MKARVLLPLLTLLAACAETVALPAPTGDHAIGRTTLRFVDPDRAEAMTDDPDDHRELTVHVWYPATPTAAEASSYVSDLDALKSALDRRTRRVWERVQIHAVQDAPVAAAPERFPVIVVSHGNDMIGAQYSFLIEELVSHGFAVVAIDHAHDARAVRLGDGRVTPYLGSAWPALPPPPENGEPEPDSAYARFYRERVEVRAADASFVLDRLEERDPTAELGDGRPRLDFDRVGFVGHSVGGVAAGQWCRDDPRADACVNLDGDSGFGPFYLDAGGAAFDPPYLMLTKPFDVSDAQLTAWGLTREAWTAKLVAQRDLFFGAVTGGSWRVEIGEATHQSFTDEPYVFAVLAGDDPSSAEAHMKIIRACVLAFFDHVLEAEPALPLTDLEPGVHVDHWPGQDA